MKKTERSDAQGWEAHARSQLRYFRSLSLRQRLEAVEAMADLVRRFDRMRLEGAFRSAKAPSAVHEPDDASANRDP